MKSVNVNGLHNVTKINNVVFIVHLFCSDKHFNKFKSS